MNLLALGGSDCEIVRDALVGQPVNSLSSLAYVAAAVLLWRDGPRAPTLALASVGVASFLYHGPMPAGAEALHDGTIVALAAVTAATAWRRRSLPRPPTLAVAALAVAVILNLLGRTGAPLCQPDSLAQAHAAWHVLTAAAAVSWLAAWPTPPADPSTRPARRHDEQRTARIATSSATTASTRTDGSPSDTAATSNHIGTTEGHRVVVGRAGASYPLSG